MAEDEVPIDDTGGAPAGGGAGGSFITRRIGPFPVWAWGVIGFTGFFVISAMRKKNTANSAAQAQANTQGLQAESANAAADNLATESWPMPANYGGGSATPAPVPPSAPQYPGSPMIPSYPNGATSLDASNPPDPSPAATQMGGPNSYG